MAYSRADQKLKCTVEGDRRTELQGVVDTLLGLRGVDFIADVQHEIRHKLRSLDGRRAAADLDARSGGPNGLPLAMRTTGESSTSYRREPTCHEVTLASRAPGIPLLVYGKQSMH